MEFDVTAQTGSWSELFGAKHRTISVVLASGVALAATNEFLALSLMPSVVDDVGGRKLYAWVTAVYLVASVLGATLVAHTLRRLGPRRAYTYALIGFALASTGCGLAPGMDLLLLARSAQGLAAGLLTGLAYAVITVELPAALWTKGSALVSAMWGVGTLVGPAVGGMVAQFSTWRWAFAGLAVAAAALAVVVSASLSNSRSTVSASSAASGIPLRSLIPLCIAALAVSATGLYVGLAGAVGPLAVGLIALVTFLRQDRRSASPVLPPSTYEPGPMKWIYLTMGGLMAATMVDLYVPLLGQEHAGLTPIAAGFLGACPAFSWTAAEIASAAVRSERLASRLVSFGPFLVCLGLGAGAVLLFAVNGRVNLAMTFATGLLVVGCGVGISWPHLSAWAMSKVSDPIEGSLAGAAINTVQLISGAFGAALAGMVVNTTGYGNIASAGWLFVAFGVVAIVALLASLGTRIDLRGSKRTQPEPGRHRSRARRLRGQTAAIPTMLESRRTNHVPTSPGSPEGPVPAAAADPTPSS